MGHDDPLLDGVSNGKDKAPVAAASTKQGSAPAACLQATMALVGAGTFAVSAVLEELGLAVGVLTLATMGFIARNAVDDLVRARISLARTRMAAPSLLMSRPNTTGLADLTTAFLGSAAGRLVRLLLTLMAAGISAVHATLGSEALYLAVQEFLECANRTPDAAANSLSEQVCNLGPSAWVGVVVVIVLPLTCLQARRLAPAGALATFVMALSAIAVAVAHLACNDWTTLLGTRRLPWMPRSRQAFANSSGTLAYVFCMHTALLPPIADRTVRRDEFSCVATVACSATVVLNIWLGLFLPRFGPAGLRIDGSHNFRLLVLCSLSLSNIVLFPTVFTPALSATAVGRWPRSAHALLIGAAACLARLDDLGKVTNLVGGTMQCIVGFMLPPCLALWVLPWQSTVKTLTRVCTIAAGFIVLGLTLYAACHPEVTTMETTTAMPTFSSATTTMGRSNV